MKAAKIYDIYTPNGKADRSTALCLPFATLRLCGKPLLPQSRKVAKKHKNPNLDAQITVRYSVSVNKARGVDSLSRSFEAVITSVLNLAPAQRLKYRDLALTPFVCPRKVFLLRARDLY